MTPADLAAVEVIALALYPDLPERPAIYAERLALAPDGCLVLAAARSPDIVGYAVTHPWHGDAPPPLDSLLGEVPRPPPAWHVHDVAVLPSARGRGFAARALRQIGGRAAAAGAAWLTLVAIGGKADFWRRAGFAPVANGDAPALASYGADALFMAASVAAIATGDPPTRAAPIGRRTA